MNQQIGLLCGALLLTSGLHVAVSAAATVSGKELFATHCAGCHYQGGNLVDPSKPLTRLYREANGVRTKADLVAKMRRGGQGMPRLTAKELREPEARAIAEYILVTFD